MSASLAKVVAFCLVLAVLAVADDSQGRCPKSEMKFRLRLTNCYQRLTQSNVFEPDTCNEYKAGLRCMKRWMTRCALRPWMIKNRAAFEAQVDRSKALIEAEC